MALEAWERLVEPGDPYDGVYTCPVCDGQKLLRVRGGTYESCRGCGGLGRVWGNRHTELYWNSDYEPLILDGRRTCPECLGWMLTGGELGPCELYDIRRCPECYGYGHVPALKRPRRAVRSKQRRLVFSGDDAPEQVDLDRLAVRRYARYRPLHLTAHWSEELTEIPLEDMAIDLNAAVPAPRVGISVRLVIFEETIRAREVIEDYQRAAKVDQSGDARQWHWRDKLGTSPAVLSETVLRRRFRTKSGLKQVDGPWTADYRVQLRNSVLVVTESLPERPPLEYLAEHLMPVLTPAEDAVRRWHYAKDCARDIIDRLHRRSVAERRAARE